MNWKDSIAPLECGSSQFLYAFEDRRPILQNAVPECLSDISQRPHCFGYCLYRQADDLYNRFSADTERRSDGGGGKPQYGNRYENRKLYAAPTAQRQYSGSVPYKLMQRAAGASTGSHGGYTGARPKLIPCYRHRSTFCRYAGRTGKRC